MNEILQKPNGAIFFKADIHLHTPFDKQFSSGQFTTDEEKKEFVRSYMNKALKNGLKIIAITEHNDTSWLPFFNVVGKEAEFKNKLTVFPGVEIGSNEGIHLLVLFNPVTSKDNIDRFLVKIGIESSSSTKNSFSKKTFNEIFQLVEDDYCILKDGVKQYSAVLIPAHADSDNGLLKQKNAASFYENSSLIAVQINKKYENMKEGAGNIFSGGDDNFGNKSVAVVESSDARALDDIGKNASYIKLSVKNIEGLRQAFLDPEARIRHEHEYEDHNFSRLLAVKFEGGYLNDFSVHFNPNLNCLIGGKGTGKSTIIEVIKYALEHCNSVENLNTQSREILGGVFRHGSKVSLLVESIDLGKKYLIEGVYPNAPVVKDFATGGVISGLKPGKIFPRIDIYRQKEIYELSNQCSSQLDLIDRFYSEDVKGLNTQRAKLHTKLKLNQVDIEKLEKQLSDTESEVSDLPELKEKLKKFKDSGINEDFKNRNIYENEEKRIWGKLKEEVSDNRELFEELSEREYFTPFDGRLKKLINSDLFTELNQKITCLEGDIKSKIKEISELLERFDSKELRTKWKDAYTKEDEKYQKKLREIQISDESFNPEKYIQLEKDITGKEQIRNISEKYKDKRKGLYQTRKAMVNELRDIRAQIFRQQNNICREKINKQLEGILKVELQFEGRTDYAAEKIAGYKTGMQKKQIDNIVEASDFSFIELAKTIRCGETALSEKYAMTGSAASSLYKGLAGTELLELETTDIPTRIRISLNTGSEKNPDYKNTSRLSVGQKCTALLTLLLLENEYPILIDQPEDDLDKSFIFEDIVKKLRSEKECRQFIIATHDANIAVLGDAEQMIVLHSDNEKIIKDKCIMNSIDDYNIKVEVEKLLEGGKEAFNKRKNKYGF